MTQYELDNDHKTTPHLWTCDTIPHVRLHPEIAKHIPQEALKATFFSGLDKKTSISRRELESQILASSVLNGTHEDFQKLSHMRARFEEVLSRAPTHPARKTMAGPTSNAASQNTSTPGGCSYGVDPKGRTPSFSPGLSTGVGAAALGGSPI